MDLLHFSAEQGLWGLFIASFLAATLLPGGSEALLYGFLQLHPEALWPALVLATIGNTAGGMTSWWGGRVLPRGQRLEHFKYHAQVARWGSPILLFAWLPLVGDALCLAAGWLRLHWLGCTLFMAVGKFARYAVIAWGA